MYQLSLSPFFQGPLGPDADITSVGGLGWRHIVCMTSYAATGGQAVCAKLCCSLIICRLRRPTMLFQKRVYALQQTRTGNDTMCASLAVVNVKHRRVSRACRFDTM
jgi:hypothetical protein